MTTRKPLRFLPDQCEDVKQGRKTMTRRPVEPQPDVAKRRHRWAYAVNDGVLSWGRAPWYKTDPHNYYVEEEIPCPYGKVGETVSLLQPNDHEFAKGRITSISVERVQEISEADAKAEGCRVTALRSPGAVFVDCRQSAKQAFTHLWDSINAKRGYGWAVNPWVWVVGFKVVG